MFVEIGVIVLLLVVSGFLASAEASVLTVGTRRLHQLAEQGSSGAAMALHLRETPHRVQITTRLGSTLVSTLAGAFGGTVLVGQLSSWLATLPLVSSYARILAFVLVVLLIGLLLLLLGELVPRQLGLQRAEQQAQRAAPLLTALLALVGPLVLLLHGATNTVLAVLGARASGEYPQISDEDVIQVAREAVRGGAVDAQSVQFIEGVFRLGDRTVRQIMTPRVDMHAIDGSATIGEVLQEVIDEGYSRYPVYDEDADDIIGVVHVHDMLRILHSRDENTLVRDAMMTRPVLVPENARAALLLALFRNQQRHMAIVVSELGSVEGIVTLEDALEEIVGDIRDEHDEADPDAIAIREDGSLLIDGSLPIDRLKDRLRLEMLPEEEFHQYDTLAGMVLSVLGRIPSAGEYITWGGWRFEVMDMDGLRIDKVLVQQEEPAPEEEATAP
jgi:putative hemolysin